jgi:hypothetical protein
VWHSSVGEDIKAEKVARPDMEKWCTVWERLRTVAFQQTIASAPSLHHHEEAREQMTLVLIDIFRIGTTVKTGRFQQDFYLLLQRTCNRLLDLAVRYRGYSANVRRFAVYRGRRADRVSGIARREKIQNRGWGGNG